MPGVKPVAIRALSFALMTSASVGIAKGELPPAAAAEFNPGYFASAQPTSALDMVKLLPGFHLEEGDPTLRGYSGAGGNILIDGQRPPSKHETLEDMLSRIPARAVDHIELVRSSASGFDMQGYAILANVVRSRAGSLSGRIEAEHAFYRHGHSAPRVAAELTYRTGDHVLDLAGAIYREIDDEHGFGSRDRFDGDGVPLRIADYGQPEGNSIKEISGSYGQPFADGSLRVSGLSRSTRMFANIEDYVHFPRAFDAFGTERVNTRDAEFGLNYDRPLGARTQLEILAIYRASDVDGVDRSFDPHGTATTREESGASETIVRGVVRRQGTSFSLEAGLEGALNMLDSRSMLAENGVDIPLPAADVTVEETRAELSLLSTWRLAPLLSIEAGGRYEMSKLAQSGDSSTSKSLAFLKPRLLVRWSPSKGEEVRFLVEREVGQLEFENFISSASLTSGSVTAGNEDLEPDSLWRAELTWEHRFGDASLVLTARHEAITHVVDRVPIVTTAGVFDAVGNIGGGRRDELQADVNLPLVRFGLKGMTIRANGLLRRSRVADPSTGERRRISGDLPVEGKASFTHDLVEWHLRWGVNYAVSTEEASFKVDEIEIDRVSDRIDMFVEYKPTTAWTFRIFGKNLTSRPVIRVRDRYAGLRGSAPIDYVEKRVLNSGRYFGASVQYSFEH